MLKVNLAHLGPPAKLLFLAFLSRMDRFYCTWSLDRSTVTALVKYAGTTELHSASNTLCDVGAMILVVR